LDNRLF